MGAGGSARCGAGGGGDGGEGGLWLPNARLRFSSRHLAALDGTFGRMADGEAARQAAVDEASRSALEALVVKLVTRAGAGDVRFRARYLVALHSSHRMKSRSLEYLVRLDALCGRVELLEGPPGRARLRPSPGLENQFREFLTPDGLIWRDKLVSRWVELLAAEGGAGGAGSGGGAGRVLDVEAAEHFNDDTQFCYLEQDEPTSWSRAAVVAGATWVRVRASRQGHDAEAKLVLGVSVRGWPALADYPARVPLPHAEAPLHYDAAMKGFYVVAASDESSGSAGARAASWQLWQPATEAALDRHHAPSSCAARVAQVLNATVDVMRSDTLKARLRCVSRYLVANELRWRLEGTRAPPADSVRAWANAQLSVHVLATLDRVLGAVTRRSSRHYVYAGGSAGWKGGHGGRGGKQNARDLRHDADCLLAYLGALHEQATADIPSLPEVPLISSRTRVEQELSARWKTALRELRPAGPAGAARYSENQLRYIVHCAGQLRQIRKIVLQETQSTFKTNLLQVMSQHQDPIEELIYLMAILLDQARDFYINSDDRHQIQAQKNSKLSDSETDLEDVKVPTTRKIQKLRDYYDTSATCLVDAVRRDQDTRLEDLSDDMVMIKSLLKWLYRAVREDKKYLSPILQPYLDLLFETSHENCWFLEEFLGMSTYKEVRSLNEFCQAVISGTADQNVAIFEAARNFVWAKTLLDFANRAKGMEAVLVFDCADGTTRKVLRPHRAAAPEAAAKGALGAREKADAKQRLARRCVLDVFKQALASTPTDSDDDMTFDPTSTCSKSEEFLTGQWSGDYWSDARPDLLPGESHRQQRGTGSQTSLLSAKKKYHTLRSLVYAESCDGRRRRGLSREETGSRSAGSTVRVKGASISRPTILETLDFINGVKNALSVEESGTSDVEELGARDAEGVAWACARDASPLNAIAQAHRWRAHEPGGGAHHRALANLVPAMLAMRKYTAVQAACDVLRSRRLRLAALFALHRLARAHRRASSATARGPPGERYRRRPLDFVSGDEANIPPPPSVPPPPLKGSSTWSRARREQQRDQWLYVETTGKESKSARRSNSGSAGRSKSVGRSGAGARYRVPLAQAALDYRGSNFVLPSRDADFDINDNITRLVIH